MKKPQENWGFTYIFRFVGLSVFTVIFAIVKFGFCASPETFLLYFDPFAATVTQFKIRAAYPYAIIASVVFVTVFGIIWLVRTSRFARAIINDNSFSSAVGYFKTLDTAREIESNRHLAGIKSYLYLLIAASCFTLDLSFTDLDEINILPHFVFTALAALALFKLFKTRGKRILISVFTVLSTAAAVISTTAARARHIRYMRFFLLLPFATCAPTR